MQSGVIARRAQKARGKEEEGLGCLVVPCAVEVGTMREHAKDPVERRGEFVPASKGVEET